MSSIHVGLFLNTLLHMKRVLVIYLLHTQQFAVSVGHKTLSLHQNFPAPTCSYLFRKMGLTSPRQIQSTEQCMLSNHLSCLSPNKLHFPSWNNTWYIFARYLYSSQLAGPVSRQKIDRFVARIAMFIFNATEAENDFSFATQFRRVQEPATPCLFARNSCCQSLVLLTGLLFLGSCFFFLFPFSQPSLGA